MALSDRERERRYNIIHVMKGIKDKDDSDKYVPPVYEESDPRMKDLGDIQEFLKGKSLPYFGVNELPKIGNELEVSLFFLSNKDVKVEENSNLLRFGYDFRNGRCYSEASYQESCSLESFIGLPTKVDSPDFKSVSDITMLCNASEIYNVYKQKALDIVRMRMPAAYSMFTGGSISHYQVRKGDSWWSRYNIRTLAVTYDTRFSKFIYLYYPEFILECAFDEWLLNRESYESLTDCYCYTLAFMITHEMMHLINHNTTSTIDMGNVGGHRIVNQIQDSFINCKISRVFKGVDGITAYGNAPMPRMGVGSSITVRAEHNVGFKKYENLTDLTKEILKVIVQITKEDSLLSNHTSYSSKDISKYAGADVFISIDISPNCSILRGGPDHRVSSAVFQKLFNEIVKTITEGRVFDKYSKLSDEEKETDKPALEKGTLVQVKGTSTICQVNGYDEESKEYDLLSTELKDVVKEDNGDGSVLCTPVYMPSGSFGKRLRREIRPFNPLDNSWVEASGEREKKDKLSDEELKSLETEDEMNVVDKLIAIFGKDLLVRTVKPLLDELGLHSLIDKAEDLIEASIGKSVEECKQILGDILHEVLSDILKEVSNSQNSPMGEPENEVPIFHVGDIVWVRRKRKFGRIVSISNGMFSLEEVEEVGVRILDDSSNRSIVESAPRMVLKERVFKPTGKNLGEYPAFELETFDMEYIESTEDNKDDGNSNSAGKPSTVPPPKDDNPIGPDKDDKEKEKDKSSSSSGSGGGDESESEKDESGPPDDWDINGNDIDDEDPIDGDNSDVEYTDGDSTSGSVSSDDSGDSGDLPDGESEDGDSTSGEGGSDGELGDSDEDDSDGSGDMSGGSSSDEYDEESEDEYGDGDGSGEVTDEDDSGDDFGDYSDGESSDSSGEPGNGGKGSGKSGGGDSEAGSSGGADGGDISYDDDDWESDDSWSVSDLEKALDKIESEESNSSKQRRVNEEEREDVAEEERTKERNAEASKDEVKAARDMLGKAIKDSRKQSEENQKNYRGNTLDESDVLDSMGAGSLTSAFSPKLMVDWKVNLERILDLALGFDIMTNPNLVNKKLEDAPPGREDEIPDIKSILVLLDCSGSMGADKFKQVIQHLETMFMVRKMDKTMFHIIDWGTTNVQQVSASYKRVKGKAFKREIMTHKANMGSTNIIPAFLVASQKVKKPDAVIIMTDAEIFDGGLMGVSAEGKIAAEFVKKHKKKIIWVVTTAGGDSSSRIREFDSTALSSGRVIKFKK